MAEIPVTSLTIGIAATPDDRRRLARLLGDTEAFLIVSSVDQARKFLDIVSSPESATTTAAEITRGAAAVRDTDPGSVGGDAVFAGGVAGDAVITHRTADDQPVTDGMPGVGIPGSGIPGSGGTVGDGETVGDAHAAWNGATRVAGDGISGPRETVTGGIRVRGDSSGAAGGGFQAAGRMDGMVAGAIGVGSAHSIGAGGTHGVGMGRAGADTMHGVGANGGAHSGSAHSGSTNGAHGSANGVRAGGMHGVGAGGVTTHSSGTGGIYGAATGSVGSTHGGGMAGGTVVSGATLAGRFVVTSHGIPAGAAPPAVPTPAEPPVLRVDSDRRVLRWQDREIDLTPLEHDFLNCLIASPDQIWTYKRLHLEVWGNEHLGRGSDLHSVVRRIRRKLAWLGASAHIQAVRGVGFRYRDT
jgi:hypothetical protein